LLCCNPLGQVSLRSDCPFSDKRFAIVAGRAAATNCIALLSSQIFYESRLADDLHVK
jgi:hypothetical protein